MSVRTASNALAFAPVRIGLTVVGTVVSLLGVAVAVKPDMVMGMLHAMVSM